MRIIGLRVFHYVKETEIDMGTYENQPYTKHIICGVLDKTLRDSDDVNEYCSSYKEEEEQKQKQEKDENYYSTKVEIELSQKRGMCSSGYTTASWAFMKVRKVKRFHGITHFPKEKLVIDDIAPGIDISELKNEVFSFFSIGETNDDEYYPMGFYKVNMDLFEPSIRYKDNRQVYIITGPSGVGKSFIAHQLKDLSVYETDYQDILPGTIIENVVVIGNKYKFSVDDVKSRLFGNPDVHIVNFT